MMENTRLESFLKTPIGKLQQEVLTYIRERGSATCHEAEIALGLKHQTVSARIKELKDLHLIRVDRTAWDSETGRHVNIYTVT